MPTVSVIVPVYKAIKTLPRCVKSVLEQPFQDLELILVDDGSPDASGALCDSFAIADSRVHVIHKENGGVSSARNAGLEAADSQWVIFLDADDFFSPFALSLIFDAAKKSPDRLVLWQPAMDESQFAQSASTDASPLGLEQIARLQIDNYLPMPWNKLYNLSLIRKHNLQFDCSYTLGEDLLFCMDYFTAFKNEGGTGYLLLKNGLTFYDQSCPDSLTKQFRPDFYSLWQGLYSRLLALCENDFHCPAGDIALLRQVMFSTFAAGCVDILNRSTQAKRQRRKAVKSILKDSWLRSQRKAMAKARVFSSYEPAILLASPWLLQQTFRLFKTNYHWFLQIQYTGTAIRQKLFH